ncbi:MAG: hypothetical protein KAT68_02625 [Bacteroidales bacterium]|nr:hypothetical protein [Bacteroidales bacterium]
MKEVYRLGKKYLILIIVVFFLKGLLTLLFIQYSHWIIPYSFFDSIEEYRENLHLINNYFSIALTYLTGMVIALVLFFEIKGERKQLFGLVLITIIKPFIGVFLLLINKFYKLETLKNNEKE